MINIKEEVIKMLYKEKGHLLSSRELCDRISIRPYTFRDLQCCPLFENNLECTFVIIYNNGCRLIGFKLNDESEAMALVDRNGAVIVEFIMQNKKSEVNVQKTLTCYDGKRSITLSDYFDEGNLLYQKYAIWNSLTNHDLLSLCDCGNELVISYDTKSEPIRIDFGVYDRGFLMDIAGIENFNNYKKIIEEEIGMLFDCISEDYTKGIARRYRKYNVFRVK